MEGESSTGEWGTGRGRREAGLGRSRRSGKREGGQTEKPVARGTRCKCGNGDVEDRSEKRICVNKVGGKWRAVISAWNRFVHRYHFPLSSSAVDTGSALLSADHAHTLVLVQSRRRVLQQLLPERDIPAILPKIVNLPSTTRCNIPIITNKRTDILLLRKASE